MRLILLGALGLLTACTGTPLTPVTATGVAIPPDTFTLVIKGYAPQAGNQRVQLFVSNFSTRVVQSQLLASTARDGLDDNLKTQLHAAYGFNLTDPESVVTGFADLLLFKLGITTAQQPLLNCATMTSSSDDLIQYTDVRTGLAATLGLRDCEKQYLNMDPSKFDNAGNNIPDYLKLRCGINPLNESDAYVSTAGDGVANIDKCKQNIPIDELASDNRVFAYQYSSVLNQDGTEDLKIANIPIISQGADNFIAMYLVETNLTTQQPSLMTAFAILKAGYVNQTLNVAYWNVGGTTPTQQQVNVP